MKMEGGMEGWMEGGMEGWMKGGMEGWMIREDRLVYMIATYNKRRTN